MERKELEKLAHLARLELTEFEFTEFEKEIEEILEFLKPLQEISESSETELDFKAGHSLMKFRKDCRPTENIYSKITEVFPEQKNSLAVVPKTFFSNSGFGKNSN